MCIKRRGSRPVINWNYLTLRLHECGLYTSRDRAPAPWASAGRGQPAWASAILVCVFCGCSPSNEPPQEEEGARRSGMAPTILGVLKLGCLSPLFAFRSALFSLASAELSELGRQDTRAAAPAAVRERRAHIHDGRRAPAQEKQERARGCGRRGGRRCGCGGRNAGSRTRGSACRRRVRVQAAVPRVSGFAEARLRVLQRRA